LTYDATAPCDLNLEIAVRFDGGTERYNDALLERAATADRR